MLNLANLAEEVEMVRQKKMAASRRGGFADEGSAPTESDIDETIQRLVHGLGKTPREVFDALRTQTTDLVFTAHPTQSVRRSLLEKHARSVSNTVLSPSDWCFTSLTCPVHAVVSVSGRA
jgi:phosphoenolpyruvate carboxylase